MAMLQNQFDVEFTDEWKDMIVEHLYKMDLSVESEEGSKAMTSA